MDSIEEQLSSIIISILKHRCTNRAICCFICKIFESDHKITRNNRLVFSSSLFLCLVEIHLRRINSHAIVLCSGPLHMNYQASFILMNEIRWFTQMQIWINFNSKNNGTKKGTLHCEFCCFCLALNFVWMIPLESTLLSSFQVDSQ